MYESYDNALKMSKLPKIEERYHILMLRIDQKCTKNHKTQHLFPLAKNMGKTRFQQKYHVSMARKDRFFRSAIPTMARLLNEEELLK